MTPAQECAAFARGAQERLAEQGYDPTVVWSPYQVGNLGQAEYAAYSAGASAFNFEYMTLGNSDPDELLDAFMNGSSYGPSGIPGAHATCVEYYGY